MGKDTKDNGKPTCCAPGELTACTIKKPEAQDNGKPTCCAPGELTACVIKKPEEQKAPPKDE